MNEISKQNGNLSLAGRLAGIAVAALAGGTQQVDAAGMDLLPGTFITSPDYANSGTTVGTLNHIAGNFSSYVQIGPDVFYTFSVLTSGNMKFTVTPSANYDPGLGLFTGNGNFNGITHLYEPSASEWKAGVDVNDAGGNEEFSIAVFAGQTYNLVIDSSYDPADLSDPSNVAGYGTYTLKVEGSNGVTLMPEPGSALMLALGAAALGWRRHRRVS